jgi:DNA-binding NtrC family response regulator
MPQAVHLAVLPARGDVIHYVVGDGMTTIGSSPDADVFLPDPELAAIHARIEARATGYVLVREAQPLLVNGHRAHKHLLEPYDSIVLGKNALSFRPGRAPSKRETSNLEAIRKLHAFARRILAHEDPETLAPQLVDDLLTLTGAQRGTIVRFGADDDPSSLATATQGSFSGPEIAYSRTLLARMQREGKGLLVEDALHDPELRDALSLVGVPSFSAVIVPIASEGRLLGALYVSGKALHSSSLDLLELYAGHAGLLLESERRTRLLEARLDDQVDVDDATLLIGQSPPMLVVKRIVAKVAASRAPVLVTGDTGTGKEVVAREIHRLSSRARGPFVAVNCGAIPHELLASELFGHVRGAFSQAHKDRLGYFRSADGGTLLLDEIGEMPLAQQVALLRVLAEERVTPVGSDASIPIDVRLVFATNRPLEAEVAAGRFRQDLFFRIAVVTVALPSLHERGGDVLRLAEHFLRHHAREQRAPEVRFSDEALAAIRRGPWEGNVRQLDASVRRAVLLRDGDVLTVSDLGLRETTSATPNASEPVVRPLSMARDEFLRGYVRDVVERMGGNRTAAADALLVTPRTIFKYLEE